MELAKITTRGQITIPASIRKRLSVKDGDKVIFFEENGRIIVENSAMIALKKAQEAFQGEAERLGLKSEQDVVDMVNQVRHFDDLDIEKPEILTAATFLEIY